MAHTLKPSEAVSPTDGQIYEAWGNIHVALRDVLRLAPPEVVHWLAYNVKNNDAVVEAAESVLRLRRK